MLNFLKKQEGESNAPEINIMGLAMAFMTKDKQAFVDGIMPFLTQERIAEAAKSFIEYFNEQQAKKGEGVRLRVVLTSNTDMTDVAILVYRFEGDSKGEVQFEKYISEITDTDIKPIIDAILSAVFTPQP